MKKPKSPPAVWTPTKLSKTMESRKVPGLFFIGEVVDLTGHLGGFNFQWAWPPVPRLAAPCESSANPSALCLF
jgi:hypothetical protein